jgi:hypothetical protein
LPDKPITRKTVVRRVIMKSEQSKQSVQTYPKNSKPVFTYRPLKVKSHLKAGFGWIKDHQ